MVNFLEHLQPLVEFFESPFGTFDSRVSFMSEVDDFLLERSRDYDSAVFSQRDSFVQRQLSSQVA